MEKKEQNILQINSIDCKGGAAKVATDLQKKYQQLGYPNLLAVDRKMSKNCNVIEINNDVIRPFHLGALFNTARKLEKSQSGKLRILSHVLKASAEPRKYLNLLQGVENFNYPDLWDLLDNLPFKPDIIHAHNLHGNYFDLRSLHLLSRQFPFIITLHDMWLLTGHCAQPLDCQKWKTGCGKCPDLSIFPSVRKDATHYNWLRKKKIYSRSTLYVAAPSQWLMTKIKNSILKPALLETRVIPNGVDLSIFHPGNKHSSRQQLDINQKDKVLLFVAKNPTKNVFKDYRTIRTSILKAAGQLPDQNIHFIVLGEKSSSEHLGNVKISFIPYQSDISRVATYYQASDIYLHASHADTSPLSVIEAMACGRPVIATATGGITELINTLEIDKEANWRLSDKETGFLVPPGDADKMAEHILHLLNSLDLCHTLGKNAAFHATQHFDLHRQAETYLTWYNKIISKKNLIKII